MEFVRVYQRVLGLLAPERQRPPVQHLAVIAIFVLGTRLALRGEATVGDIVSFMGFVNLIIGRLEHAMGFASRLFFQLASPRPTSSSCSGPGATRASS